MYQISVAEQLRFLFYSVAIGAFLALLYCPFRIRRMLTGKRKLSVLLFLEDLGYCLVCCLIYTVFVYCANLGIPRFYSAVATALGFALFHLSLGKLLCHAVCALLRFLSPILKAIFGKILGTISKIIKFFLCKITINAKKSKKLFIFLINRFIMSVSIRSGRYARRP